MSIKRFCHWPATLVCWVVALGVTWSLPHLPPLARLNSWLTEGLAGGARHFTADGRQHWLEWRAPPTELAAARALVVDEDPQRYFERLPPPPADWMVMLARLHQSGTRNLGLGMPLAWENPDPLALEAMGAVLDRYQPAVLGCALKDGTLPTPMPAPFLRASVPVDALRGPASKLPVVNGLAGARSTWGAATSWAGFLQLRTEQQDDPRAFLLAKWADRVVFCQPLALEIARRKLEPATEVIITPGVCIALGDHGPRIAIDERGRTALPAKSKPMWTTPASGVIADTLPPGFLKAPGPLYVTDTRLLAASDARDFARQLPRLDQAIRGAPAPRDRLRLRPAWSPAVGMAIFAVLAVVGGRGVGRAGWLRLVLVSGAFVLGVLGATSAMLFQGWHGADPLAVLAMAVALPIAASWGRRKRRTTRVCRSEW